ncbi:MAG: N-acetylmuramoyl-L-alanine amidase [Pleurocapsa sp. SU_196_0]|nr:N-acetylmuramoyl-L-alanine amidase [Pleurocapsa sp. SU_196_0]
MRGIVIHTSTASLSSMDHWFTNADARASAHYGVALDGTVHQYVREADTAFHAGVILRPRNALVKKMGAVNPNSYLIGIENEDLGDPMGVTRTESQIDANVELVYRICKGYKIKPSAATIIPHRAIRADKLCPGNMPVNEIIRRVVQRFKTED